MKLINLSLVCLQVFFLSAVCATGAEAQEVNGGEKTSAPFNLIAGSHPHTIFDDKSLIEGYAKQYQAQTKEILLEMVKDDTLSPYQGTAAIRAFREQFAEEVVGKEKVYFEKFLLRRLDRADSPFVQVEIMHTLCILDRYRYFAFSMRSLIQKLDHYNSTVNDMAYTSLNSIIESGQNRTREARIIFDTLSKVLFLSRKKLAVINDPGPKLSKKIKLLRWSIKILGSAELKKLPKEVLHLL
ncbi:MAG: hypothetical protein HQL27_02105 [Candidatus Omnitrophica bacterium]|nr:hypothetical protein [Candidatus Omnitrophota bacterium]